MHVIRLQLQVLSSLQTSWQSHAKFSPMNKAHLLEGNSMIEPRLRKASLKELTSCIMQYSQCQTTNYRQTEQHSNNSSSSKSIAIDKHGHKAKDKRQTRHVRPDNTIEPLRGLNSKGNFKRPENCTTKLQQNYYELSLRRLHRRQGWAAIHPAPLQPRS